MRIQHLSRPSYDLHCEIYKYDSMAPLVAQKGCHKGGIGRYYIYILRHLTPPVAKSGRL